MSTLDFSAPVSISGLSATSLSALAAGGYALLQSSPVAKPAGVTRLALRLTSSTATSAQVANETLSLHLLEARDGTNFSNPPGTTAQAAPLTTLVTQYNFTGGATTIIDFPIVECPDFAFGFLIHNNSASELPTATWTAALYGFTETLS